MLKSDKIRHTYLVTKSQIPLRYPASEPARELVCDGELVVADQLRTGLRPGSSASYPDMSRQLEPVCDGSDTRSATSSLAGRRPARELVR